MSDFNPYSRRLHADPYPAYAELREERPLVFNSKLGFWAVARHDDVAAALKNADAFASGMGITLASFSGLKPMIILMDPPRQTELRALLLRAFTPRAVASMEGKIRAIARDLIDSFHAAGSCDFVRDFAAPFPTTVIAEMLGVDPRDRVQFKAWSDAIMTSSSPAADSLVDAYEGIFEYFAGVIDERRRRPGDDLVSALVAAEVDGKRLSEDELLGFCALLLIAGNETMANFLSNALLALDRHPAEKLRLLDDFGLMPTAVEELLRFEPPVHELGRTTTRDVEIAGGRLPKGARVLLLLASANRDPRRFHEPDRLQLDRAPNPHLAFGLGIHFCMGAGLARLEARIALEELLRSIPDYRVSCDHIAWFRTPAVRGPATLPIAFEPKTPDR